MDLRDAMQKVVAMEAPDDQAVEREATPAIEIDPDQHTSDRELRATLLHQMAHMRQQGSPDAA